ncbi:MAG: DUF4358 domain-containing protein [Huintestinicola sp.]|uniref:DUF4358 domain-containing protein n=1 Tax=Huintestinicola sp. TaxID=2981661 RepID=UPI003F05ECA1
MKKTLAAACAALCALTFSACSGESDNQPAASGAYTEISASEEAAVTLDETGQTETEASSGTVLCGDIANAVMAAVELPSMAEVGADRIGMYLDLTIPDGCDFSMYICGSGGFADEVFVINTDGMSADDIKSAAEKRIETRKKDFEGYNPDEFDKLDNYFSAEKNGYYIYAVTCDNSACESIFDEYVK